jgi:hypothetical protein
MIGDMKPLVVFGCVHIGHRDSDLQMAKRYVQFVKDNDALALLLADNHECALPSWKGGHMVWDQNMTPQEQYEYGLELFRPIAKNIIGACTGNHAGRAQKVAGMDLDRTMAERLGYLSKYQPYQGFTSVKVGKITYKIAFKHGGGMGSNTFGNPIQLMRHFPSADICCASHTHELATTKRGFWDIQGGSRKFHEVTLINTASLLNYPKYADEAGYAPQGKGFAIAFLSSKENHVRVDTSGKI